MVEPPNSVTGIPDKLFFKIGEVSRIAGVPTSVLRFWESEFPRIKPQRTQTGQRVYRRNDVTLILTIKHLLYDRKFTIPGARDHLNKQRSDLKKDSGQATLLNEIRTELYNIRKLLE